MKEMKPCMTNWILPMLLMMRILRLLSAIITPTNKLMILFFIMFWCVDSVMYRWRMVRTKMRLILRPIIAKMAVKFKVKLKMIICILQSEEFASRS